MGEARSMTARVIESEIRMQIPCVVTIVGSTSSGKTTFVYKLFENSDKVFSKPISKILYCYSCYQPLFDKMKEINDINFVEGLPSKEDIIDFAEEGKNNVIVLDDLMTKVMKSEEMLNLFCQYSHHLNLTVLFLTQNVFHGGKFSRTLNLNSHYYILFRNRRDVNQIGVLGRQLFPGKQKEFLEIYNFCCKEPYGYLFVDLHPRSEEVLSLRTHILDKDQILFLL